MTAADRGGREWSYTRLACASDCPRRYQHVYVEGHPEPGGAAAHRGTRAHELVEQYSRLCIREGREYDYPLAVRLSDSEPDSYVAEIIRRLPDWLRFDPSTVLADESGVERWFELPLEVDGATHLIRGRIDRLERNEAEATAIVWDYKSGMSYENPGIMPIQLRLYAWAARQIVDMPNVSCRLAYLGSRTVFEWDLPEGDLYLQDEWVRDWVERVTGLTEFPERPGSWCQWCGRLQECARGRLVAERTVGDAQQAKAAAGHLAVLEAAVSEVRENLRTYVKAAGPVICGDLTYGYHLPVWAEQFKLRYQPREGREVALVEALREMGEDPADYISTWNTDKLGKLLENRVVPEDSPGAEAWMGEEELQQGSHLAGLVDRVEPRPTFGSRKVKHA